MNNCTATAEKENMISIWMTEEDAELFMQFRQYQDVFSLLVKGGVFENTRNSKIELNCGNNGIDEIKITKISFSQRLKLYTA